MKENSAKTESRYRYNKILSVLCKRFNVARPFVFRLQETDRRNSKEEFIRLIVKDCVAFDGSFRTNTITFVKI